MSRLIRVFPRRTKATPNDALAYFGPPDRFAAADAVHVSVAFTWDKPRAEQLAVHANASAACPRLRMTSRVAEGALTPPPSQNRT
jgi:hypothetical protein